MILDTDFLITLDGGDDAARSTARDLESRAVPLRVPTVVIQELYVAVGLGSDDVSNARKYDALLVSKPVVPLTDAIARRAGVLEGQHIGSDSKPNLGPADAIVAATALQFDEPVVSSDVSDFGSVHGFDVVSP